MIKNNFHRVFFASSALIGGIISKYVISSEIVNIALLGIVAGALLYTITRESIPRGNKGDPAYFLLGTLLFTAIILVIWNITSSLY
jgi:zinc transporter ZupT